MSGLHKKILTACLALTVLGAVHAADKDLKPAIAALKRGDSVAAINHLLPLAKNGNVEAQFMLVSALQTSDQQQAGYWLRKAADNRQPDACHILGLMYLQGNGVVENAAQAKHWLSIAAEAGVVAAQLQLGLLYRNGPAAMQDDREAFKWFDKAADSGNAEAQYQLAEAYRYGYGVAADPAQVRKWLERAARQGHSAAMQALAVMAR